jgi:hypothetical protein
LRPSISLFSVARCVSKKPVDQTDRKPTTAMRIGTMLAR